MCSIRKVIEKYGSIYKTPSYLVKVVPVINIDGEAVAEGNPVMPGGNTQISVAIKEAGCNEVVVNNPVGRADLNLHFTRGSGI